MAVLAALAQHAAQAQHSTFSTDAEAWSIAGDGIGPWVVGGGNPGGCLQAQDLNLDAVWYWSAPCSFLGNKSASLGQYLRFDRKVNETGPPDPADVVLEGNGITIGTQLNIGPQLDWMSQSVQLVASQWHKLIPGNPPATPADMLAVLSNLTKMWIKGEYSIGTDLGWLDNVILEPVGEPMTIPVSLCEGEYLSVQGHSQINPIAWQWSFPGGFPSTSNLQFPPGILYDEPGIYPVGVIISNSCYDLVVDLGEIIIGKEYEIDTAITLCYGAGYPFDGYVITEPGDYFGLLDTYLNCDSAVTLHVSVLPELWGEAAITPVYCPGRPEGIVEVTAFGGVPPYSGELTGPSATLSGPGPFPGLYAGEYDYVITDASGCAITVDCTVDEPDPILLRVEPSDTLVEVNAEFQFRADCNYPVLSYQWEPPMGFSCLDCPDPLFSTDVSTGITLRAMTQVNDHQCEALTPVWIEVRPRYFVPNSFTPDGDQHNDVFRIVGANLDRVMDFQIAVFGRSGEPIFESTAWDFEWDGTSRGAPVPVGVYAWTIEFREQRKPGRTQLRGHVTVVR